MIYTIHDLYMIYTIYDLYMIYKIHDLYMIYTIRPQELAATGANLGRPQNGTVHLA